MLSWIFNQSHKSQELPAPRAEVRIGKTSSGKFGQSSKSPSVLKQIEL